MDFNIGDIMKQVQGMSSRMKDIQESMKSKIVEGDAGAGMVKVRMNGAGELLGLDIEKGVIDPEDPEMLADLIVAAVNNTRKKAEELKTESIRELTGGIDPSSFGINMDGIL
ncbi:MAG: YbaB/EbfC family nucleoid-associated protein [Planctomycetes bacterium]|nr:YbaB/EbfC family nucleoid-associated protein [Planctomycetota bacterium]